MSCARRVGPVRAAGMGFVASAHYPDIQKSIGFLGLDPDPK
jgi:hypothetical protein